MSALDDLLQPHEQAIRDEWAQEKQRERDHVNAALPEFLDDLEERLPHMRAIVEQWLADGTAKVLLGPPIFLFFRIYDQDFYLGLRERGIIFGCGSGRDTYDDYDDPPDYTKYVEAKMLHRIATYKALYDDRQAAKVKERGQ